MTEPVITSTQNPRVKAVVQLHQNKVRRERGQILVEGLHPLEEAIQANLVIDEIYIREDADCAMPGGAKQPVRVTEPVMAKMCTTESPPPVLAVAKAPSWSVEPVLRADTCLLLAIIGLQDPGNLGTLIRAACAFGVKAIFPVGSHVDPYHPKVIRASAGLVFRLPVVSLADFADLQSILKQYEGIAVWAADPHQGQSYREITYNSKTLIILGSEAHGLPESVWNLAQPVHIPMQTGVESLNVGVAGAIILCEAFQQCQA